MLSRRRRCTGSSSTIRMVSLIRNLAPTILCRFGPLWPSWVNAWIKPGAIVASGRAHRYSLIGQDTTCPHPVSTNEPLRQLMPGKRRAARAAKSRPETSLGILPEWNLADLYLGLDDPQVQRDLDRADAESVTFEQDYKSKLAGLAGGSQAGSALADAIKRYEALDDLLGRLVSYAGLVHSGDTVDPARAKFYADVQERVTAASTHLLFFTLELNRLDDAQLEAAMQDPALAHYR